MKSYMASPATKIKVTGKKLEQKIYTDILIMLVA